MIAVDGCSVTKVCKYVGDIIPSDINTLYSTPIDSPPHKIYFYSTRANILVIPKYSLSTCQIVSKTGLGKSTMTKAIKEILSERENIKLGHPCKLFSIDKRKIVLSVITGKAENAVQATHHINSALPFSLSAQNIHNVLKAISEGYNKEKVSFFPAKHKNWNLEGWTRVIWSDEMKMNMIGSDGMIYVWKKRGKPL